MKQFVLIIALIWAVLGVAQPNLKENLSAHVYYLSDDLLEGRATGSEGERLALKYISDYFRKYSIAPKGTDGYMQPFDFNLGSELGEENYLLLGNKALTIGTDYFPMPYSGNGSISAALVNVGYGIHAPGLYDDFAGKNDISGKIFVMSLSSPDGIHPHSKYSDYTDYLTRIKTAEAFGASGIIFVNDDKNLDDPKYDLSRNVQQASLPIVFVSKQMASALLNGTNVDLSVNLEKNEKIGHNVLAYINNRAENTVVIGAHYDHLGHGESGGSLYRGEPAIHNGADDNASGVAMMIELSRMLKNSDLTNNNYLFIAFSGEELGLYGSKSFTHDPTVDLSAVNYMINFDMVGRLDEEGKLALNGVGTSPSFESIATSLASDGLTIKTTESGMGPSDHSSFYLKDIPVLHFYTGNNPDYHKPSDDPHLINYDGMETITHYTYRLIAALDKEPKLVFQKTVDQDNRNAPKFKVTLGVVPDYMFDEPGMRIDGVTDGKPAANAGIQAGDVVVKMGAIDITDMMSYMTALSKFQKGETATVLVKRNNETVAIPVTF